MKLFYLIILTIAASLECSQNETLLKVEYKAETRGASKLIAISKDKIEYNILNTDNELSTKEKDWKTIEQLVNNLDINNLKNLKRPTRKSQTDAAMQASLIITFNNKTVESSFFDDGNPPKEIKDLVDKLFEMISK